MKSSHFDILKRELFFYEPTLKSIEPLILRITLIDFIRVIYPKIGIISIIRGF